MKSSSILTKAVVPKRAQEEIMMTRQVPNDAHVRVLALILRRRRQIRRWIYRKILEEWEERVGNNPEANTPTILAQRSLKPTLLKLKPIVANPSVHDANAISRGLFLQSLILDCCHKI